MFHDDLPRGSIDWIPVPLWPTARTNVADVVIAVGLLVLGHHLLRAVAPSVVSGWRSVHASVLRTRVLHLVVVSAAVVALGGWTVYWQANRQAAVPPPSPRPSVAVPEHQAGAPTDDVTWSPTLVPISECLAQVIRH
jgi:hypothetical protein